MIESLGRLTVSQFVELICGDTGVLTPKHEVVAPAKLREAVRGIIFEYNAIAHGASMKSHVASAGRLAKARAGLFLFSVCRSFAKMDEYGRVKEILEACGADVSRMDERRVDAEITSRMERAKRCIAESQPAQDIADADSLRIRSGFDAQTAALMAHFRFQIDPDTMKASCYARLVARHDREVRAQIEAMKKK